MIRFVSDKPQNLLMLFMKYNFVPSSLNRLTGELHDAKKKVIWNDGEDDYTFTIDKVVNPKNEYVLLRNRNNGKYMLKKIDISRSLRYDRNIKKSASPAKQYIETPSNNNSSFGSHLTPTNHLSEESSAVIDQEFDKALETSPPTEKQYSKSIKITYSQDSNVSLEQAIFGDAVGEEIDKELDLVLGEDNEDLDVEGTDDTGASTPKSLNSMYND